MFWNGQIFRKSGMAKILKILEQVRMSEFLMVHFFYFFNGPEFKKILNGPELKKNKSKTLKFWNGPE